MSISLFKKISQRTDSSIGNLIASIHAYMIVLFFPRKKWYWAAERVSFFSSYFAKQVIKGNLSLSYQQATSLNRLITFLSFTELDFPVPVNVSGIEHLTSIDHGLFICGLHIPLIRLGMREILARGIEVHGIISDEPLTPDGKTYFMGSQIGVPTIVAAEKSSVLLKTKRIISSKGSVAVMIDSGFSIIKKPINPNILNFCGKVGGRIVFLLAERDEITHEINARFLLPPYPFCQNEQEINDNLIFLTKERDELYARYQVK